MLHLQLYVLQVFRNRKQTVGFLLGLWIILLLGLWIILLWLLTPRSLNNVPVVKTKNKPGLLPLAKVFKFFFELSEVIKNLQSEFRQDYSINF